MRNTLATFALLSACLTACAAPAAAPVEAPSGGQATEPSHGEPPPAPPEPPAEPGPTPAAGAPDYACQQASDCAVKNVGNCCGYYPRCVNKDSVFEPVKCAEGVVGVCGYPEITRCECTAGRCESIEGESVM